MQQPISLSIPLDSITYGDRYRQEYDDKTQTVEMLAQSILENGLINRIVVGLNPNPDGPKYLLAAGGRRLSAFTLLAIEREEFRTIPASVHERILGDLELRCIELEENIRRKDLTYVEDIKLKEEVHRLKTAIHGEKISRDDASGWTQKDTANLFGTSPATLTEDLQLAKAFHQLPELGLDKMKNKSEAKKLLKSLGKVLDTQRRSEEYQNGTANKHATQVKLINSYISGDFFEGIKQVPNETIDLIELDPPYGVKLQAQKKGYTPDGYNEIPAEDYPDFLERVLVEAYRVMKEGSWLILWFGPDPWFETCYQLLTKIGFKTSRKVGIWVKGDQEEDVESIRTQGQTMQPMTILGNGYEFFYYASKGKAQLNQPGHTNVFPFKPVPPTQKIHPTERPLELISTLLNVFTPVNSRVLVPFLGSGKTLLAAFNNQMHAMGWELNDIYKERFILQVKENLVLEPITEPTDIPNEVA